MHARFVRRLCAKSPDEDTLRPAFPPPSNTFAPGQWRTMLSSSPAHFSWSARRGLFRTIDTHGPFLEPGLRRPAHHFFYFLFRGDQPGGVAVRPDRRIHDENLAHLGSHAA